MKYYINVNQVALADSGLDFNDGAILDYLCVLAMSRNAQVARHRIFLRESDDEEFEAYTWADYSALLAALPMLPFKGRSRLSDRVKRIEAAGYIKTNRQPSGRLYFCLTPKADELFLRASESRSENRTAKAEPFDKSNAPVRNIEQVRSENRTYTTNKDSINNDSDSTSDDVVLVYQHYCTVFGKSENRYRLSNSRRQKIKARLKDAGKEMLLSAIDKCHRDDFYSGRSKRWHGADLDWIISSYEHTEKLSNLVPNSSQSSRTSSIMNSKPAPVRREQTPEEYARARKKVAEIKRQMLEKVSLK